MVHIVAFPYHFSAKKTAYISDTKYFTQSAFKFEVYGKVKVSLFILLSQFYFFKFDIFLTVKFKTCSNWEHL